MSSLVLIKRFTGGFPEQREYTRQFNPHYRPIVSEKRSVPDSGGGVLWTAFHPESCWRAPGFRSIDTDQPGSLDFERVPASVKRADAPNRIREHKNSQPWENQSA